MNYEYHYNMARNRYNNAVLEIAGCTNRINELSARKQQLINLINQLKTDLLNNQAAFDSVTQTIKGEDGINTKLTNVGSKTDDASANYTGMVSSSDVTVKNLVTVFSNESTITRNTVTGIFSNLRAKEIALNRTIIDLQNQIRRAESDLAGVESSIRSTQSSLGSWNTTKVNASYDMEYYRRKMLQAG